MKRTVLVLSFGILLAIIVIGVSAATTTSTYIPIVYKAISPTPTVTPTPTATPIPGPILLPNGDFEQGHVSWHEYASLGLGFPIINYKTDLPVPPYDGSWAAWMGGAANGVDTLDQTVLVPADHPYLSFWMYISSTDYCGYDVAYFFVDNTIIGQTWLCSANNTYGWVKKVYDLHSLIGQHVDIMVYTGNDLTHISSLYLDHFAWQSTSTAENPVPVNISDINANAIKK